MKHKLTAEQVKKFVEGFNAYTTLWNAGESDGGKTPYRANSWGYLGYEAARSQVLTRQVANESNIKLKPIDSASAQPAFNVAYS